MTSCSFPCLKKKLILYGNEERVLKSLSNTAVNILRFEKCPEMFFLPYT